MIKSMNTYELVMKAIEGISSNELLLDAIAVRVTEALEDAEKAAIIEADMENMKARIEGKSTFEAIKHIDARIRALRDEREHVMNEHWANIKAQVERAHV